MILLLHNIHYHSYSILYLSQNKFQGNQHSTDHGNYVNYGNTKTLRLHANNFLAAASKEEKQRTVKDKHEEIVNARQQFDKVTPD